MVFQDARRRDRAERHRPDRRRAFVFTDRRNGEDVEHRGNYLVIDRPHRLVFIFSVPKYSVLETTVTLIFAREGQGCRLTLQHDDVPDEMSEKTKAGWTKMLLGLANVLGEIN